MPGKVVIDCFPESLVRYDERWAVVAVDVIRATTTAVTAASGGRRCYPVGTLEAALELASQLDDPLLVGELGGNMPFGFHITNSPAEIARRDDVEHPMILLSTAGTRLLAPARPFAAVYAACLRNLAAQTEHLIGRHQQVAVIGAGARRQFRLEDQLACAWIAGGLVEADYEPVGGTGEIIDRWRGASVDVITGGASADYLRASGQLEDLEFILAHVDDVDASFEVVNGWLHPRTADGRAEGAQVA
jgi:2-phosphosulfolactate phosphatase